MIQIQEGTIYMAIYIGFQTLNKQYVEYMNNKYLTGELPLPGENSPYGMGYWDPRLNEVASGFREFLEKKGVKLIARYNPVGRAIGDPPGLLVIDTDNDQDLNAIKNYYTPFLDIHFYRYNSRYSAASEEKEPDMLAELAELHNMRQINLSGPSKLPIPDKPPFE